MMNKQIQNIQAKIKKRKIVFVVFEALYQVLDFLFKAVSLFLVLMELHREPAGTEIMQLK